MTSAADPTSDPSLIELDTAFQAWLEERAESHAGYKREPANFEDKLELLLSLQHELFDAGWAHYGWPEELGGKGGTVLHRAVVAEVLERNGFPPRHVFEHLDILPPALARFAQPAIREKLFLPTLRGDVLWCQGFSEPTAGSDLAALRTRAEKVDGGYRIDGHKIWTSWAKWATHCFFLARTGTPEDRHRGLSAFVIETSADGVTVGPIKQATGTMEFAEVFFDGAFVPEEARVGAEGQGWAVAMHILAGERGSYTWLRQSEMLPRLEALARSPRGAERTHLLGEALMRLIALRCRAREVMEILARGEEPGPESSVSKVLAIDSEQFFYEVAREILLPGLDLGTTDEAHFWQEHYLYSRASSVYGGSREIQLNVIAKLMISRGGAAQPTAGESDELAAVRASVEEAANQSEDGRTALEGLDWWSFAAEPSDAFGRAAFSAWFETQGGQRVLSPALAAVRTAAAARCLELAPDRVALAVSEQPDHLLVVGLDAQTRAIAIQRDNAWRAFEIEDGGRIGAEASAAFDAGLVQRVNRPSGRERVIDVAPDADARAEALARIAAALEILGASRALLRMAVEHSNEREQFGQPIARFQAIQHLISESQIEVSALEAVCRAALEEWSTGGGEDLARIAKAQAGRDGRRIAQRALQCFGAIGFTDEHAYHHYSRRIHTLDAILGSHSELRDALGRDLARTGRAPRCIQVWHPTAG